MGIFVVIIAILIAVFFVFMTATYIKLSGLRKKVNEQWSRIDVELKKRFDLIPSLVNMVKGYINTESQEIDSIIKIRNKYLTSGTVEHAISADDELSLALSNLYDLVKSYSGIIADESFIQIQNQLEETENKIKYACKFYNDSAAILNNAINKFPSNLIAKMYRFKKVEYFKAQEIERENENVDFKA